MTDALKKFLCSYPETIADNYSNLHFERNGLSRLAHCDGFFRGLLATGKADVAEAFADDLDRNLTNLNDYGGMTHIGEKDAPLDCLVPAYRISLGDDGTFGGFTLLWHRLITLPQLREKADKLMCAFPEKNDDSMRLAFEQAKQDLSVRNDLELRRGYYPTWDKEHKHWTQGIVHYGYSFNGGLLFSGPGGDEIFSVTIGKCLWSVHT